MRDRIFVTAALLFVTAALLFLAKLRPKTNSKSLDLIMAASSSSPVGDAITAHREESSGLPYLLYKPPAFVQSSVWPLILFLHGAGESGDDPWELLSEGATGCPLVEIQGGRANDVLSTSFVIVAPQTDRGWSAEMLQTFMAAITTGSAKGQDDLRIDAKRMYATGVSMGGYGAWEAGTLGLFAAIAPVCGAGTVEPSALGDTPVWAFHGANDIVVPVQASDQMVEALRMERFGKGEERRNAETGNVVKYTRYKDAPAPTGWESYLGHASWKDAYRGPELFEWMLQQSKP